MARSEPYWYIEYVSAYHGYLYAVKRYVFCGETACQRVAIADTFTYGRALILDGKIQSTEFDEHIYHEALIHPAVIIHGNPKQVLIMGGGEGAVLRELCRYPGIENIVMVDIDSQIIELSREYLSGWHQGSYDDSRVELLHLDARRYLEETDRKFDIIYSDLTEPEDGCPSKMLYTKEFYSTVKNRLNPGALLVIQAGGFGLDYLEIHSAISNTLDQVFDTVHSYHTFIPSFDCDWGYIIVGADPGKLQPGRAEIDRRLGAVAEQLQFYDGETHEGMFCLPKNIRLAIKDNQTIIEDGETIGF